MFKDYEASEIEIVSWWMGQNQGNDELVLAIGKLEIPEKGAVQDRAEAIKSAQIVKQREANADWGEHIRHIDDAYLFVGYSLDKMGVKTPMRQLNDHHSVCEIESTTDCYGYLKYDVEAIFISDAKTIATGQFIDVDNCPSFIIEPTEFLRDLYIQGMKIRPRQ